MSLEYVQRIATSHLAFSHDSSETYQHPPPPPPTPPAPASQMKGHITRQIAKYQDT